MRSMVLGVLGDALCVRVSINLWRHTSNLQDLWFLGVLGVALCVSGCSGYLQSGEFYCTS